MAHLDIQEGDTLIIKVRQEGDQRFVFEGILRKERAFGFGLRTETQLEAGLTLLVVIELLDDPVGSGDHEYATVTKRKAYVPSRRKPCWLGSLVIPLFKRTYQVPALIKMFRIQEELLTEEFLRRVEESGSVDEVKYPMIWNVYFERASSRVKSAEV